MKRITLLCSFLLSFCFLFAQNGTEPVKLTDMLKIKTVGNIVANNEGTMAAFTVTSIEPDEKKEGDYKYVTQLYKVDLTSNAAPVQLTFAKESSSGPAWSPDGKTLAFTRAVDGKPQIFLLPMSGGEAYQLTKFSYGASSPKWSPDGKQIFFASGIGLKDYSKDSVLNPGRSLVSWPFEKPGLTTKEIYSIPKGKGNPDGSIAEIRSYLLNNEADGKATVLTKLNFQDEMNVSSNVSFNQFFVVDANGTSTPKLITHGFYRWGSVEPTPDGKKLLITADVDSLESPDRSLESEIYLADADGGNLRLLLSKKGVVYGNAKVSPSGKWLAYTYGSPAINDVAALAVMPLNGSEKDAITIPFDRSKSSLTWSKDETFLYFTAQSDGGVPLYRLKLATKKIEPLSDFNSGVNSFALGKNKIVFSKTELIDPSGLYSADLSMANVTKLSSFNDWVKTKKLSLPEKHTFVDNKGLTVEYWVMKPAAYEAGKKYPLLLEIHGGPTAMWGPGEASMWHEFQYFCGKGYGVVYSNPRGSGGYGDAFLKANTADWGAGPTSDVLTALDKTVAEGWADTSKLLVTGGSYAGYLVAWIISHDHRFKAACSQRGVYDLATFFGEGNAWRLVPSYFGGYPWEPKVKELLQHESPINYVQNISTPYIIFHGDNDRRTGFVQGEMMYRSLKVLNRPVEYVRHPGATHELTRSGDNRQRMDQMLRTYEFFERWIH
ncbi:S9 family peptidase [Flavisolibacter ginsenosidimutans]|uniref:S9 family peptidase n=1 Tax=Flavisolibacter ginsenosidimutans TaxID=661481 RepID=A0A5B8UNL8_9BACT|nr:S9 family peptidase [Flavisolibacter ginsenosidimutans]QEC58163.1 S9 family peptidase [Flavisolibacter ginsenosidimutans]